MRTLAIDLGTKRIGLAMSDEGARWATPLEVLFVTDPNQAIEPILKLIKTEDVKRIVIGLPLNMDGTLGGSARKVIEWTSELTVTAESLSITMEIVHVDERLSSFTAEQQLTERKKAGEKLTHKRKKQQQDAVAAAGFLQAYLDGKLQPRCIVTYSVMVVHPGHLSVSLPSPSSRKTANQPASGTAEKIYDAACTRLLLATFAVLFFITPHFAFADSTTQAAAVVAVPQAPPAIPHGTVLERLHSLLGLVAFIFIAWGIGKLRKAKGKVRARTLLWGIALQFIFGAIVFLSPGVLAHISAAVKALLDFTAKGASFVFADLSSPDGAVVTSPSGQVLGYAKSVGYFAFFVLPTIIFFSCLTAIAYHSGVMQYVVQGLAWIMAKTMGCSGAETLCTAANIFVGQAEAPLMVKPFVAVATQSELLAMMVGSASPTSPAACWRLYTIWLSPYIPTAAGHLAAACFIALPGSLLISKLFMPETETAVTAGGIRIQDQPHGRQPG